MFFFKLFDLKALGFGGSMALIDGIILSCLKAYQLGWIQWNGIIITSVIIYAFQPLLFLESLKYNSLTSMNLLWDVMSDIIVTVIGLFYFKEKLGSIKRVGLLFSFISMILLSWKE